MDPRQSDLSQEFMHGLETKLGLKHQNVSFAQERDRNPPEEAGGLSLLEYILNVSPRATKSQPYNAS
jgi:hypothetical protein